MDPAHRETDKKLAQLEEELRIMYAQAEQEVEEKLNDYMRRFEIKDKTWKRWVETGVRTQDEYIEWRKGQIMMGKRWEEMRDTLAQDLTNVDQIARSTINGYMPEVYAINHNYGTYTMEKGAGVDTSYTLYSRSTVQRMIRDNPQLLPAPRIDIPKDLRWNSQHIQNAVLQGIVQGEPIAKIATRLQGVTDMDRKAAIRNARTAITGAENAGRLDSWKRGAEMGIKTRKCWIAVLDRRTRSSHRMMDGVTVDLDENFPNGLERPGDPAGDPEEVYNCRCSMISQHEGFEIDVKDLSLRSNNLGDMTYEEWLVAKPEYRDIRAQEKTAERIKQQYINEYRSL